MPQSCGQSKCLKSNALLDHINQTIYNLREELKQQKRVAQVNVNSLFNKPSTNKMCQYLHDEYHHKLHWHGHHQNPYPIPRVVSVSPVSTPPLPGTSSPLSSSQPLPCLPIFTPPGNKSLCEEQWHELLIQEFGNRVGFEPGTHENPIDVDNLEWDFLVCGSWLVSFGMETI